MFSRRIQDLSQVLGFINNVRYGFQLMEWALNKKKKTWSSNKVRAIIAPIYPIGRSL